MKKKIWKEVSTLYVDYEYATDIIEKLQGLQKAHGEKLRIEKSYYPYSDDQYLAVMAEVEETDKEYEERLAKEEKYKKEQDERDRRELERLKKKFGDGNG